MATEKDVPRRRVVASWLPDFQDNNLYHLVNEQTAQDVFWMLVIFRCINSACVSTFFQPDEYFQSLEPAWQMAFGPDSGAWITWEWQHQLRSSLHPALFALPFYLVDKFLVFVGTFPQFRASVLTFLPNVIQACFTATGEYYMWQLSERIYGIGSDAAWATVILSALSPWQWFCSTRTFSNCLETALTMIALYFWPWQLSTDTFLGTGSDVSQKVALKKAQAETPKGPAKGVLSTSRSVKHLRISLLLAATAIILRPTNALIWFCIVMPTLTRQFTHENAVATDVIILIRESVICGLAVLAFSFASDYLYYGALTFPPYQLLNFNISQDIAVFYGRNDFHYYLTQGLPLLLTTALPFALVAIYKSSGLPQNDIRSLFTTTILFTLATLSLISHKEVRFIYPLLPLIHIITGPVLSSFFTTPETPPPSPPNRPKNLKTLPSTNTKTRRKPFLYSIIALNLVIAFYTTQIHQSGVLSVQKYIRTQYQLLALSGRGVPLTNQTPDDLTPPSQKAELFDPNETFIAYLMPCHSTPWRSSLYHPDLKAWALTCEPPLSIPPNTPERENYRDEADRFYDNPMKFLKEEIGGKERPWPRFVVGFEGIEGVLKEYYEGEMVGFRVKEKWRTKNSQWNDDERRQGDVVVWEFVEDREEVEGGN